MERRTALRTAATGVLAGLAIGVGTASAQLPVPDVPEVKVPDVPSVPVPQVPSLPAPPPAPQVPQLPPAPQVPQVPQVPRSAPPAPAAPSAPVPRTPVTSGGGGGSSSPSSSGGGSGGGAGGSAATSALGGSAARPAVAGDEGDEGDGQAAPQRRLAAQRHGQRSGAAREQRLRETVHRLAGCLDDLRPAPRRVLVLRSGYGPGTPLSRSQVGDRLDLAAPRVKRLERRGLRRLRTLQRHGGCGGGAASLPETRSTADTRLASTPGVDGDDAGGGSDAGVADAVETGLAAPASAVKDLFQTSPSADSGQSSNPPATVVQQPSGGIGLWSLLAFVTGLGLLGFAVRRELNA